MNMRIVKNTCMLYMRMFFTMLISLYASRVVLNTLGIEDFGIYNVVASVVMTLSFLNSSISSATQRFLTFEIGKGDYEQLKKIFSMSLNIHAIIAVAILVLAETIGLWLLNTKLIIPTGRIAAANWVYQFTILSFMLTVMCNSYNAIIIAHERMNVYAYISITDVALKLAVVFALVWLGYDKLKMYAILFFCVTVVVFGIYRTYCKHNFTESNYNLFWDKSLFSSLLNFSGWNLLGSLAWTTMGQGLNILLNLFFGPAVNAAWGIAFQINSAVAGFANNIRMAVNPQIVKSHAAGAKEYMNSLVFESAKYSFYLLLIIALPMLLEINIILRIWLKIVPDYTIVFCQLILINTLIQCFDASFGMIFQAIGKIKENQLFSGGAYLLVLPISYILLKLGSPPQTIFYVQIAATIFVAFIVKIFLLQKLADIPIADYSQRLIFPILKVTAIAVIPPILIRINMAEGIWRLLLVSYMSFISIALSAYYIGMNKPTRIKINNIIWTKIFKSKQNIAIS